jgi:ribonucleoside-triphosphate reductase
VQGTKGHYYLTNSSHIPVSSEVDIIAHIENANIYHPKTLGGNILHLWLKEVWSDPKSYWKLNKKILEGGTIFWAYSKVFTYCNECGFTLNDKIDVCPICKSKDLITYDRCTGYYLPTNGFNNGKQQEFKDRFRHNIG